MMELAREADVFIVKEEVERGYNFTVPTMQRCVHVAKGVCRCILEREGSCKISFIFNYFLQVISLKGKLYGFLGSLTCSVKQKRLFSFSSLLFSCNLFQVVIL